MTDIFVDDTATGAANGTTWADAYTTISAGITALSTADRLIIANTHSETFSSNQAYTLPGDNVVISSSVTGTTTVTYLKATAAQLSNGSLNHTLQLVGNRSFFNGVFFETGNIFRVPNCAFYDSTIKAGFGGANPGPASIQPSTTSSSAEFNYCDLFSGSTASTDGVLVCGNKTMVEITGGSLSSARTSENSNHAAFEVTSDASLFVNGMDCSGFQTDQFLKINAGLSARVRILRVRLNANTTLLSTLTATEIASDITIEACDDANNVIRKFRASVQGVLNSDTGIKLSDSDFSYSNKIETNATAQEFFNPVRFLIATDFADFATTKTINVEIAQDGTTTGLTDSEFWIEVIYPDDSTSSYLFDNSRATDNQSGTTIPTSTEAYDGLSGSNVKQKIALASSQTGKAGSFEVYAVFSKPSTTVYVTVKSIS